MSNPKFAAVATDIVCAARAVTKKQKHYPLAIEAIGTDVDPYHIYFLLSRGHHDVHEFMKKVREEGYGFPLEMPIHLWFRLCPNGSSGFKSIYVNASQGERGSFPVTRSSFVFKKKTHTSN
ncbi:hypothetical protein Rfer_4427 (plasmid) [Rhodoferax ferrireducens T118]|uniref:Uncharacterized protein n=1 Tax=Albidiferax ferrireducens (strain ATCC BAA-621 / DSM 15236 / T118) TaxID=338969 RepID=Q21Q32_ALBFT|nr:hypothetical protein [Rhodoferax ferrireducens]ABD72113.1 hypothetical protein Rfer_4427 [Rhodoferax ferrireducens T118]